MVVLFCLFLSPIAKATNKFSKRVVHFFHCNPSDEGSKLTSKGGNSGKEVAIRPSHQINHSSPILYCINCLKLYSKYL